MSFIDMTPTPSYLTSVFQDITPSLQPLFLTLSLQSTYFTALPELRLTCCPVYNHGHQEGAKSGSLLFLARSNNCSSLIITSPLNLFSTAR